MSEHCQQDPYPTRTNFPCLNTANIPNTHALILMSEYWKQGSISHVELHFLSEHCRKWLRRHVGLLFPILNTGSKDPYTKCTISYVRTLPEINNTYVGLPNSEYCKQDTISHEELNFPYMKTLSNNPYPTCTTLPTSQHLHQGFQSHMVLRFQVLIEISGSLLSQFITCIILSLLGRKQTLGKHERLKLVLYYRQ